MPTRADRRRPFFDLSSAPAPVLAELAIRGFRALIFVGALAHALVFREPLSALIALAQPLAEVPLWLRRRGHVRQGTAHGLQLAVDLALVVTVLGAVQDPAEVDWPLLLLPVILGAVRWQLAGALITWFVGQAGVWLLHGPMVSGEPLVEQVTVLAVAIAVGIMAWRLGERLRELEQARREGLRRSELLTAVAESARTVTTLDPDEVLQAVSVSAGRLGFAMTEIAVVDTEAGRLRPVVQRGWPEHHPPVSQPLDSGIAGAAHARGVSVLVDDYQQWDGALAVHVATGIARAAAGIPIVVGGRCVAVLVVADPEPRTITGYERDCLELLATQAGVALRNARIHDERQQQQAVLEHQATHDMLTGVANRAHFLDVLTSRLAEPFERRGRLAVAFVDLDDFKGVNDDLGHLVGDELLRILAERLRYALRPTDLLARYGGDEFTILFDHCPENLTEIGRRLHATICAPLELADTIVVPGASIGIAVEERTDDVDALLRRADDAMYEAKASERSHVIAGDVVIDLTQRRPETR